MPAFLLSPAVKIGGGILLVVALVFGFNRWLDGREDAAFARGRDAMTQEVAEANARANGIARALEVSMGTMSTAIGQRTAGQSSALTVKLEPLQKELTREIQADAGARCAVSAGVRRALEDQRATVNAGIAASDPGQP